MSTREDLYKIHAYKGSVIDKTKKENPEEKGEKFIRKRIKNPEYFHKKSFRFISLGEGIKATIGCPKSQVYSEGKCQDGTQIQALLFSKDRYTKESAKTWIKKHPKIKARRKK